MMGRLLPLPPGATEEQIRRHELYYKIQSLIGLACVVGFIAAILSMAFMVLLSGCASQQQVNMANPTTLCRVIPVGTTLSRPNDVVVIPNNEIYVCTICRGGLALGHLHGDDIPMSDGYYIRKRSTW